MERKAYAKMLAWKSDPDRRALLVRGPRQVGKTHLVRKLVRDSYRSCIYLDMEGDPRARAVFGGGDPAAERIFERLSYLPGAELIPHETAVVIDGIQGCPSACFALGPMSSDGRYDIIATGSSIGAAAGGPRSQPPEGRVDVVDMMPMDFEEFLWATGMDRGLTEKLRRSIQSGEAVSDSTCQIVNDLFRRHIAVGGMPAAVSEYVSSRNYGRVREVLLGIFAMLRADVGKRASGPQRRRAAACLDSVPGQLSRGSGRFRYADAGGGPGGERAYGPALRRLEQAGLVLRCANLEEPAAPLGARKRRSSFKVYMADTGLLVAMMGAAHDIVSADLYASNGAAVENAVACALRCNGYDLAFYGKRGSTLEADFVLDVRGDVVALDAGRGGDGRAKALRTLLGFGQVARAIKISNGNVFVDENGIENYPLFGPSFFRGAGGSGGRGGAPPQRGSR